MRKPRHINVFVLTLILLSGVRAAKAQVGPNPLQPGVPVERTLAAGQSHSYTISLEEGQLLQLAVDQRGIDVVVRTFSPTGRRIGETDTPNGTDGPEEVRIIAEASGVYRIDVLPLGNPQPGRYEIKIIEVRKATEEELQAAKNQKALKAKGLNLLTETAQNLPQLRRPQTRAGFQLRAAQFLWSADAKRATKLMEQAIESVKEFIADIDNGDDDYYESRQIAMQLRTQVVEVLAPHDPEMALNFLRATRAILPPEELSEGSQSGQGNPELQLELSLASQIVAADPKRAFQIAEDTLKRGISSSLIVTLNQLRSKDPELAAKLAHDILTKLMSERLLGNPEASYLTSSLLQTVRRANGNKSGGDEIAANTNLFSEDEVRDVLQKVISEVLSYSAPALNFYTQERSLVQTLLNTLRQMNPELRRYAPDRIAALDKKWSEITGDPQAELRQRLQTAINSGSPDAALESVNQAPREMRVELYQQIANRLAQAGDVARARQIINDHITNPMQRQQALRNVEYQAAESAASHGKIEEALRSLNNFRPASERPQILAEIVSQIGPGLKKSAAVTYLEQARSMLGPSPQAEDQSQMYVLLAIGRAYSHYDSGKAFGIVEPLIDQFNEISESAEKLNGFGPRFFKDGELITNNGNALSEMGEQIAMTLSTLALANFERTKAAADRIRLIDVRINTYLNIAQQIVQLPEEH